LILLQPSLLKGLQLAGLVAVGDGLGDQAHARAKIAIARLPE